MKSVNLADIMKAIVTDQKGLSIVMRNTKILASLVSKKSVTISNPVTIYLDLIYSLSVAVNSYLKYKKEKEKTSQLQSILDYYQKTFEMLRQELEEADRQRSICERTIDEIQARISNNLEIYKTLKQIYDHSGEYLLKIKKILDEERNSETPDSERLRAIEELYYQAVKKRISLMLLITGGGGVYER